MTFVLVSMRQERFVKMNPKTITVNNLTLQFNDNSINIDTPDHMIAQEFIDKLNAYMKVSLLDACPTILSIQVSPNQIHVVKQ